MTYADFLDAFARENGMENAEVLQRECSDRYAFQIRSRDRARQAITLLQREAEVDFCGKNVLDVGCAYGSFAIEIAKCGGRVTGIDISNKWLKLADVNAAGEEGDVVFLNCDASARKALTTLGQRGPFHVVIVNDVFEHIYDTVGLLGNLVALLPPDGLIYFKVPNGHATRSVLSEGHKKVFGISLLPPDYWHFFVNAPFHIYYRRWDYFVALFDRFGLSFRATKNIEDRTRDETVAKIEQDIASIRRELAPKNFAERAQFLYLRRFLEYYFDEVESDLAQLDWKALCRKYRQTFWEGILRRSA